MADVLATFLFAELYMRVVDFMRQGLVFLLGPYHRE